MDATVPLNKLILSPRNVRKTRADEDLSAWHDLLQGTSETVTATGSRIGGLLGARSGSGARPTLRAGTRLL